MEKTKKESQMCLKKFLLFGLIAAVLPAFAEEAADRKTATSLKYVEHELDTRQNKFTAESNKAMEYTNSAGIVQQRAVTSDLDNGGTDSLPMVGGVNTKLNQKQDDIAAVNDHTAVTYTGTAGTIGQKGIYQDTGTYIEQSNNLIDAKTFNAALKKGLDSEFLCSEYKPGTDLCWVWSIHNNEASNANLYDRATNPIEQGTISGGSGSVVSDPRRVRTGYIDVEPNTQYTVSSGGLSYIFVYQYKSDGTFVNSFYTDWHASPSTFTTSQSTGKIRIILANGATAGASTNITPSDLLWLKVEVGPTATPYQPYMESTPFTTLVPAGYTPVEYIESNGTQYIDTDIKGHMNYTYELDFQQTDTGRYRNWGVFNQSTWQGQNMSFTYVGGWGIRWDARQGGQSVVSLPSIDTSRHTLRIVDGEVYFDGVDKGRSAGHDSSFVFNYNLFLGTANPAGTTPTSNANSKYYSYKVWDANGNLIQNFIPARQDSDNKVGMYDTVSGRFFPSVPANTNFAAGPDINNIIYVPQNQN